MLPREPHVSESRQAFRIPHAGLLLKPSKPAVPGGGPRFGIETVVLVSKGGDVVAGCDLRNAEGPLRAKATGVPHHPLGDVPARNYPVNFRTALPRPAPMIKPAATSLA